MADSETTEIIDDIGSYGTPFDILNFARRIAGQKALDIPGMDAVNVALDGYNVVHGVDQLVDGAANGDSQLGLEGVHDLIDGGAGLLSNASGELGAGAQAFSAGYAAGDLVAPWIFDSLGEGSNDGPDADGVYHPSTGNAAVDWVIGLF